MVANIAHDIKPHPVSWMVARVFADPEFLGMMKRHILSSSSGWRELFATRPERQTEITEYLDKTFGDHPYINEYINKDMENSPISHALKKISALVEEKKLQEAADVAENAVDIAPGENSKKMLREMADSMRATHKMIEANEKMDGIISTLKRRREAGFDPSMQN